MDSNDSFSLAMDTADMPGFTGLPGHHGHPGGLPPGHPHHPPLPHYQDHYDQPALPPHQGFANCGESLEMIATGAIASASGGIDETADYDPPSPDSWIGESGSYPP